MIDEQLRPLINQLVLNYYTPVDLSSFEVEELQGIQNILNSGTVNMNPYCFPHFTGEMYNEYALRDVKIYKDENCGLFFTVVDNEKKLYFRRDYPKDQCIQYFNEISMEQDYRSPHRYLTKETDMIGAINNKTPYDEPSFSVNKNGVIMDIGAGEGNFTLSFIDDIRKSYIFECDPLWTEALERTFYDYQDKAEILRKFVSDKDTDFEITIDSFLGSDMFAVDFIKMDIEGFEESALIGAVNTLCRAPRLKLVVCAYHRNNDARDFKKYLEALGYAVAFTKGFVFTDFNFDLYPPYHRKGLIRAEKKIVF